MIQDGMVVLCMARLSGKKKLVEKAKVLLQKKPKLSLKRMTHQHASKK